MTIAPNIRLPQRRTHPCPDRDAEVESPDGEWRLRIGIIFGTMTRSGRLPQSRLKAVGSGGTRRWRSRSDAENISIAVGRRDLHTCCDTLAAAAQTWHVVYAH